MSTSSDVPTEGLAALTVTSTKGTMTDKEADVLASSPGTDTNDGATTSADARIEGEESSVAVEPGADEPDDEADIGPAIYPPVLENMEILGYIKDKKGICYSRDIGRSASIHDEMYFIFGDTFCIDPTGNPVATTSNTIAYVENRAKYLESEYREIAKTGKVKAFVPLDEEEIRFEQENSNASIVFRMYGGVADIGILGVVWFQKLIKYENGEEDYCGVGQARLSTYSDGRILVQRLPKLLFERNEPRIGSFSTLLHNGYVYLWGNRSDGQIILARVYYLYTARGDRYEYWSGNAWVLRWHNAVPVLHNIQHGAIIHTHMFGKDKPFLFVGVNKQADSMIQIGVAAKVQGPFDFTAVCEATGIDHNDKHKYCIYPHLFASDVPKRELLVTWSEHPPGGVIAAKLKFKIDEVAAIKEAEERKRVAEEREARRLASIAEEREARHECGYESTEEEESDDHESESEESDDPGPRRDRSDGRLKRRLYLRMVRTSSDPPAGS